jgi:hypothetical protein
MVGKGYTMDYMHRHFSHLIAFYPLGLLDVNDSKDLKLIKTSIDRWLNRPKFDWGYKGYTYTAATAMYSRVSMPDKAVKSMHEYLDTFSTKNSFYLESGPVIETPLHSASATLEMLLQSYNPEFSHNEIRVFTSMPSSWDRAEFRSLKTQGGHELSATYENGKTIMIKIIGGSSDHVKIVYAGDVLKVLNGSAHLPIEMGKIGKYRNINLKIERGEKFILTL